MKTIKTIALIILINSIQTLAYNSMDKLTISGTYLGIFNSIDTRQSQFDFATNLDFNYLISDELTGIIQLQGGNGGGTIGFVGPGIDVTDISLEYNLKDHPTIITLGSFDTPFGYETNHLTNNGDTFNQLFLMNSLIYSALAGPVGTLNTLGIKAETNWGPFSSILSVSNGTGETAINEGNTFEHLIQLSSNSLIKGLTVTGTYLKSNDSKDDIYDDNTSFATDLTGSIIETRYQISRHIYCNLNMGTLNYGDNNSATDDLVSFYGAEIGYINQSFFAGLRTSYWDPEDNNADESGASASIATPGLSNSSIQDESIARYQISLGYHLNPYTKTFIEFTYDNYNTNNDVSAFFTGTNIRF